MPTSNETILSAIRRPPHRTAPSTKTQAANHSAPFTARHRNATGKQPKVVVATHKKHPQQFVAAPNHAITVGTRAVLTRVLQNQAHWLNQHANPADVSSSTPFPDPRRPTNIVTGFTRCAEVTSYNAGLRGATMSLRRTFVCARTTDAAFRTPKGPKQVDRTSNAIPKDGQRTRLRCAKQTTVVRCANDAMNTSCAWASVCYA